MYNNKQVKNTPVDKTSFAEAYCSRKMSKIARSTAMIDASNDASVLNRLLKFYNWTLKISFFFSGRNRLARHRLLPPGNFETAIRFKKLGRFTKSTKIYRARKTVQLIYGRIVAFKLFIEL